MMEAQAAPTGLRAWPAQRRRSASLGVLVGVIAILGASLLAALVMPAQAQLLLLAFTVAVLALLAFLIVLFATTPHALPEAGLGGGLPASAGESYAQTITLKCGNCGTIFDVRDLGTRPLHHTCPGCGAEGVLREEDELAAPPPAPQAPSSMAERAASRPAGSVAPAVKALRLRCKGCATVFRVDDTGERPLKHRCPGCGAAGIVR
ncbi:MAG TPA: zinc ribbon domain-containing protein [Candidatus Thermoplasmatota archaeon]|nr:zinc ribbon domain-containing protein [Candidatus Thermoplasmatota archaeon]